MIRQWLRRRAKVLNGFLNTRVRSKGRNYDDARWWDASFYAEGISDRQTIAPRKSVITARYHYASTEMPILRHLRNRNRTLDGAAVVDIGSGSGHWIDFYKALGAGSITGMDVSQSSASFLANRYAGDDTIAIHHGKALDVIGRLDRDYDLVNAIGVMFHMVNDDEWRETIRAVGRRLKPDGLFVIGGEFGWLDGVNVQIDADGNINKRLRSHAHWRRTLREAGFARTALYRNRAYLWINDSLPENNVLIAAR